MKNKYPIYIISKGRWESRLTSKSLEEINTPYRIVIEPQEYKKYAEVINPKKILTLPFKNLGKGSIPARNWVWNHSIKEGHKRHWILDDNIRDFYYINKNRKIRAGDSTIFALAENFVEKYVNVPMSGMNYSFLVPRRQAYLRGPFFLNNRVYSCILLSNEKKYNSFRWRGRYNEDTDLSIRFLKAGYCTILFNAYVCGKRGTMKMKGGNTDELYKQGKKFDGRLEMAKHLQRQHPEITKIVHKWGRWQHSVDYSSFKKNKLIKRKGHKVKNVDLKKTKKV